MMTYIVIGLIIAVGTAYTALTWGEDTEIVSPWHEIHKNVARKF